MLASQLETSLGTAGASLEIAEQLDLADICAHALNTIGVVRVLARDRGGIEQLEQSLAVSLEQNHAENIVRGYKNLASMLFELGELERLPELYAGAVTAAERFGDTFHLRWFAVEQAIGDYLEGRWDDSLRTLDTFIADVEAGAPHYMEAAARTERAGILLARGEDEAALADTSKAVDFGRSAGEAQILVPALTWHTCVLFGVGKLGEAEETADELLAASVDGQTAWLGSAAPVLSALGRASAFLARFEHLEPPTPWDVATRAALAGEFPRAIDVYVALGARPQEAEARLLAARQGGPAARENAQRALDFYRSVKAGPRIREAEQLLGIDTVEARTGSGSASP